MQQLAQFAITQRQVLELFEQKRAYLAGKPRQFVEDLLHEAQDLARTADTFSVRTAAEINHAAAVFALEDRA